MRIKVLHWNILADKLAHDSFPKCEKEHLNWSYRFGLIKKHIKEVDPDVFGLSEVDCLPLYRSVADAFALMGYQDYFVEKSSGISGSAIFYRKSKFVCLEQNSVKFSSDSSRFFMYCRLALKNDSKDNMPTSVGGPGIKDTSIQFVFAETHLKAKP